jgi:acyl-CoA synthetase (NDP forming)
MNADHRGNLTRANNGREKIAGLLRPGPVAIVGASDRSTWSTALYRNLTSIGSNRVWLVNPGRQRAHGQACVPSISDVEDDIQLACLVVRAEIVEESLASVADHGIRNAIVIASGFAEAGGEGRDRTARLKVIAAEQGVTILGPNTSGMVNVADDFAPFGSFLDPPLCRGTVGIALQSGGIASQVIRLARVRGVGMRAVLATGNEANVSTVDVIEYLVEDPGTKVIAAFLEAISDPERFSAAALRAAELGKPIIALKVGRTEAGQRAALSHTGSVVGNDVVVDAAFREFGVIRVRTLEELLTTAGLMAQNRPIRGARMVAIGLSGGFCDLIADQASDAGLELPDLAPGTLDRLKEVMPEYADAKNPLDLTGMVVSDRSISTRALEALCHDDGADFVLYPVPLPYTRDDGDLHKAEPAIETVATIAASSPIPVVLQSGLPSDLSTPRQELLARHGLHASVGIDATLTALGAAAWWSGRRVALLVDGNRSPVQSPILPPDTVSTPWSEVAARDHLARFGVPLVPGDVATDAQAAVAIAERIGYPVAVKVVSAEIAHKTDIGGVRLNVQTPDEVAVAYNDVVGAAATAGIVEGVLVTAMRGPGTELLVTVEVDPAWGQTLTVGFGGVLVEALRDTQTSLLPVTHDGVVNAFEQLHGARLLTRHRRDGRGVDLDAVAAAVLNVVSAAEDLGDRLVTLELNPVWVRGSQVEVLDALVATHSARYGETEATE